MKSSRLNPSILKYFALLAGLAGFILRLLTQARGIDEKGLLTRFYPPWVALWILAAAAMLILLLLTHPLRGPAPFRASFPGSIAATLGCILAGVSALNTARLLWLDGEITVFLVTSTLAVLAFAMLAVCRLLEWRPGFLFNVFVCIYFSLEMLRMYQTWSFDPQLHEYCFQLFACIALTMTAYQLACFGASHGRHRMLWFWGLTAVIFCLACLDSGAFYLTGAVWVLTNLSCLKQPHRYLRMENDHSAE